MNAIDKAIGYFNPEAGLKRQLARARQEIVSTQMGERTTTQQSETKHRGASRSLRSLAAWIPGLGSAVSDMPLRERETMIARSNDAYRNHTLARAAISRNRTSVVGTGLIAHPNVDAKVLGISDDQAEELNALIATEWATYAEVPAECDAESTLDIYGQQALALVSSMLGGDCFGLTPFVERPGHRWGLKLQLVDGVRVSNPSGKENTESLVDGVELDQLGSPVRYWIRRKHPGDRHIKADGWSGVPVVDEATGQRRALHIWNEKDRIGMVRGAPFLAPILEPLQTIETFTRNYVLGAVVSSMFTVFIKKEKAQFDASGSPINAFGQQVAPTNAADPPTLQLGPASIIDLAPGESAEFAEPPQPTANLDAFLAPFCTHLAAALEMPVDELLLRYNASYSAARAAMLQAWRAYVLRRSTLVQQLCAPLYGLWFDEAVARGRIPVANYADPARRAAYVRAIWVGPARGSMDENKEATAAQTRIAIGVSNETIETAQMQGEDWRTVQAQRQRELRARARGLPEPSKVAPALAEPQKEPGQEPPTREDPQ